jgi:hypothetical protein
VIYEVTEGGEVLRIELAEVGEGARGACST